jgi:hypothetical protein
MSSKTTSKPRTRKTTTEGATTVAPTGRKKQFQVVAYVSPDGIEGSLQPEVKRPLIAHLPIQSKNISFHDNTIHYDPVPPGDVLPYENTMDNFFSSDVAANASEAGAVITTGSKDIIGAAVAVEEKNSTSVSVTPNTSHGITSESYRNVTLLVKFKDASDIKTLPEETDVACFWCCHAFKGRPVVLPIRDEGQYLQVYGNYCSPECAMAYLFDMKQDSHTRWEQLALLNRVYGEYVGGTVRPAPPRSILKLFGGPVGIDEYRDIINKKKVRVDIHIPPMVSLLSTMDTKPIDFYDANLTKNVMETVKERLQKAEEVLKLRRTKPLKAWENTLDACINLRVRTVEKI